MLTFSMVWKDWVFELRGRSKTTLTRFWLFLTTYPPALIFSIVWTLTKRGQFWPTYLPRLVNVVCERPLRSEREISIDADSELLGYFDAAVIFVTNSSLLFRLVMACLEVLKIIPFCNLYAFIYYSNIIATWIYSSN